jgi:hypothetical protein
MPGSTKRVIDEDYFTKIDSKDKAWCLGFIVADGSVRMNPYQLRIRISKKDVEVLEKIKRFMSCNYPIRKRQNEAVVLEITRKSICEDLYRLGICPDKTHNIQYPNIPNGLESDFIKGYFDGDGWISAKPYIGLSGSSTLLNPIRERLHSRLGISKPAVVDKDNKNTAQIIYHRQRDCFRLATWIYMGGGPSLSRKRESALDIIHGHLKQRQMFLF